MANLPVVKSGSVRYAKKSFNSREEILRTFAKKCIVSVAVLSLSKITGVISELLQNRNPYTVSCSSISNAHRAILY